jgi:hypothetical protein
MPPKRSLVAHAAAIANDRSSAHVALKRLPRSRMLWTDVDALPAGRGSAEARKVLDACSFVVGEDGNSGWADRYGGGGIGSNGGSGRSVVLGEYSVKGVGPTPLIGTDAPLSHSSGGAFLEEAIREAIQSRFLRGLLPHGAVPVVAIIDTGIDHVWDVNGRDVPERRVLIVRPFTLRPAHFQRAYQYRPAGYAEKRADIDRVLHNFTLFSERYGATGLRDQLIRCYVRWAEQIAFALVHDIALGTSPSNVSLAGEILDFGAVSTLPYTANYFISPGVCIGQDFAKLLRSLEDVSLSAEAFDGALYRDFHDLVERKAIAGYENRLVAEILARAGVDGGRDPIDDARKNEVLDGYVRYLDQANRLRADLLPGQYCVDAEPVAGLDTLWTSRRPACLDRLASTLKGFPPRHDAAGATTRSSIGTREAIREEIMQYVANSAPLSDLDAVIGSFATDRLAERSACNGGGAVLRPHQKEG